MVSNSKQNWTVGASVRVGFMSLIVRAALLGGGDNHQDTYLLSNAAGDRLYEFQPHAGCRSVTLAEAGELLQASKNRAARIAAQTTRAAADASEIDSLFAREAT